MKRFDIAIDEDEFGYPFATMLQTSNGKYVLAEDAFKEAGFIYDIKTGQWIDKKQKCTKNEIRQ